jgi:hypothetical protein
MFLFGKVMSIKRSCLAILAGGMLLGSASLGFGQADYPNLQGSGQRTGHSSDPVNYGPGAGVLQWYVGNNTSDPYGTILIDDDVPGASGGATPGETYSSTTPTQLIGTAGPTFGLWSTPTNKNFAAASPYVPLGAVAPYHLTTCVPSASGQDPSVASTGTASSWTWTAPLGNLGYSESYALYVWIPIGQTLNGSGTYSPSQRYFVYHINFGDGLQTTDVVDTYATGYGWVRLGGGGYPTNTVFPYDGVHPLSATLYNTIPRDSNGNLLSGTVATASNYLVYADAFEAVPDSGYYTATPTSAYLRTAAGTPVVDPTGDIDVAPQLGGAHQARITSVFNRFSSSFINGVYTTIPQALVSNYVMDPETWPIPPTATGGKGVPYAAWTWQVANESPVNTVTDTTGTPTSGWATGSKNIYEGAGYYVAPITANPLVADTVTYAPSGGLLVGAYSIYAYFPGNISTETYGSAVTFNILQGGTVMGTGTVNEAAGGGWVQLTSQTWNNLQGMTPQGTAIGALTVQLTNLDTVAADAGANAYASAVRFVSNNATYVVNSSPVHAQVYINKADGSKPLTQVVIVADETGKIHCLDETGNGDGTTTEYWSYPSTPDPTNANYQDPNLTSGIDGPASSSVPVAIMPTQFNLSTAVVKNQSGSDPYDRLYISSNNGRIYCIDMEGRGDYSTATNHPGSTARLWSYPNDYPSTQVSSTLGSFKGSLVYGDATTNPTLTNPTIFAAAPSGRVYSLDALGSTATRTTTVNWTFPILTQPVISPIEMTPNLSFGNLYFGTMDDANVGTGGTVYALNALTGAQVWFFNGTTNGATTGSNVSSDTIGNFIAGPASASAAILAETGASYAVNPSDSVYFSNDADGVYGFNAETGALLTDSSNTYTYDTTELGSFSTQNLSVTEIQTYDRTSILRYMPVVMVPTNVGVVYGLFANVDDYNVFSYPALFGEPTFVSLLAYGTNVFGANITSVALSNSRMIAADDAGYMYVWDNNSSGYGLENAGVNPGAVVPPNVPPPSADAFRYIHIKTITLAGYSDLSTVNALNQPVNANDTYPKVVGNGTNGSGLYDVTPAPPNAATGYAFEDGETFYVLVYDLPYQPASGGPNGETVNLRISENGKTMRTVSVSASQFASPTTAPTTNGSRNLPGTVANQTSTALPTGWYDDGYAVFSYTVQPNGPNGMPPGPGIISADVTTTALSAAPPAPQVAEEIAADPSPLYARVPFIINNPLAFQVYDSFSSANVISHEYAETTNRYEKSVNNNGTIFGGDGDSDEYPTQYLQSLGFAQDGQAQSVTFTLYDRSLMALLHPGGLTGVKIAASNLVWQGGSSTIYNPLPSNLYPGFEDPPINSPNNSLDYPNITYDRLAFSALSNGVATNPLSSPGATLNPPTDANGNPLTPSSNTSTRILIGTPVQMTVNPLQYQPAVNMNGFPAAGSEMDNQDDTLLIKHDSVGKILPQGYFGVLQAYVDSFEVGPTAVASFSTDKPYRQFHVSVGMQPDWKIQVVTPSIDLGSLPNGSGHAPSNPYVQGGSGPFNPWTGEWSGAYQPFAAVNNSNLNLLNLHVAKASTVDVNNEVAWLFTSPGSDANVALDGSLDLWSNLDPLYAPTNPNSGLNNAFSQKPRPGDGVGSAIVINPAPRANANLGIGANAAPIDPNTATYPGNSSPAISVSVPFGFPSGTFASALRIIDDTSVYPLYPNSANKALNGLSQVWEPLYTNNGVASAVEPSSDANLVVSFTSRETRLTNGSSAYSAPMATVYSAPNAAAAAFAPSSANPTAMRDSFGSIVAAWSSNQSAFATFPQTAPSSDDGRAIYLYTVPNSSTFSSGGISVPNTLSGGTSPFVPGITPVTALRDLDFFYGTSGSTWFSSWSGNSGYPSPSVIPTAPLDNNGTLIAGTASFDDPAFPASGSRDAITGQDLGYEYMAFLGKAQKSTTSGRINESHVFLTQVKTTSGGNLTIDTASGAPWNTSYPTNVSVAGSLGDDPVTSKGKPTVVQTSTGALVFYSSTTGSSSGLHFSRYSVGGKGFGASVGLNLGTGFDSIADPSATIRGYQGVNKTQTSELLDLTFSGKLKGRPNNDIYLAQMRVEQPGGGDWQICDANGTSIEQPGAGTPFEYFPEQINELLTVDSPGTYRARGVEWDRTQPISLYQYTNGTPTDILVDTSRFEDRETGVISYDTRLGGKVYFDPEVGSVTFSQNLPPANGELRLSYSPGFLRVTAGGASGYSDPTTIFENHYTSDNTEWFTQQGQIPALNTQDGRFVFMYDRAAGSGQTARPYLTTMRFGVRLPYQIAIGAGGLPYNSASGNTTNGFVVTGNVGPYQLDPANGRVYFTAADEDNAVTITYTGTNAANGAPQTAPTTLSSPVSMVLEQGEAPILIDQAVNESNLSAFLDPFDYANSGRPSLFWLFYTSTRAGAPDIYMQTIAPRFAPFVK